MKFFKYSPKRQQYFEECIDAEFNSTSTTEKCKKFKECCRTRWVERHDAFAVFVDFLKPLMVCLEGMDQNDGNHWNRESRGDAYSLFAGFEKVFILSITGYCLRNIGHHKAFECSTTE